MVHSYHTTYLYTPIANILTESEKSFARHNDDLHPPDHDTSPGLRQCSSLGPPAHRLGNRRRLQH